MFNQDEDWNDEADAKILSETVLRTTPKAASSTSITSKAVGKKSLLRTLQTLGPVPEWKSDDRQQDSDSEAETAPSHSKKKKKKRRKKRKHTATSDEQEENGDLDHDVKEEKTPTKIRKKNNKCGALKVKNASANETKKEEITKSAQPEDTKKLNRKQWKNKMKNRRNCKNKYRQSQPDEEGTNVENAEKRPKEEVTTNSYSNNKNSDKTPTQTDTQKQKVGKAHKPQKRKNIEEEAGESQTLGEEKQLIEKEEKNKKATTKSFNNGSKQEADIRDEQEHQTPPKKLKPELTKEQRLKREQLRKLLNSRETDRRESPVEQEEEPAAPEEKEDEEEEKPDRSASLRSRMEQRLDSARFRYINEVLYSSTSGEARRMFGQDPQAFSIYHRGYTAQVERWPANPVDGIISYIKQKPASQVVADFGCGDCKIARSVNNKVHSFDLAAACDLVTVCDMAKVPLKDRSVDIAVFCLSLMGTNLADFLAEANRVLKMGGVLKIAEVASRFDNVRSFVTALANMGFKMVSKDTENSHFYSFECVKTGDAPENVKKFGLQLKACLYKKR